VHLTLKEKRSDIVRHRWIKPIEDFVEPNVDASFSYEEGKGSFFCVAASNCGIPFVSDPAIAKAHPLRDGLLLLSQTGCNGIM
jgi:hypothetical protein